MICKPLFKISIIVVASLVSTNRVYANALQCNFTDTIDITNGSLPADFSKPITFNNITFAPNEYAIFNYKLDEEMKIVPTEAHLRGCYCNSKPCIRIFCPLSHQYNFKSGKCEQFANRNVSQIIKLKILNEKGENETVNAIDRFNIIYGPPHCGKRHLRHNYTINHTGNAIIETTSMNHSIYSILYNLETNKNALSYCEEQFEDAFQVVIGWCMLISVPFMIVTILIYLNQNGKKLRNLHGHFLVNCLVNYLIALTFAFLSTALIKLNNLGMIVCHTSGWIMYFSYFAAFLWLNVICSEIWSNISGKNGYQNSHSFKYAVGLSLMFTAIAMTMNYTEILPNAWRPGIGDEICFIKGKFARGLYFYGPLAIILGINVTLFILTIIQLQKLNTPTTIGNQTETPTKTNLEAFRENVEKYYLYSQIFILMGVSWIMEVVLFFFESVSTSKISQFFELMNAMQGVLIFILLILRLFAGKLVTDQWEKPSPSFSSYTHDSMHSRLTQFDEINDRIESKKRFFSD